MRNSAPLRRLQAAVDELGAGTLPAADLPHALALSSQLHALLLKAKAAPYAPGDRVEVDFGKDGWFAGVVRSSAERDGRWSFAIDFDDGDRDEANPEEMRREAGGAPPSPPPREAHAAARRFSGELVRLAVPVPRCLRAAERLYVRTSVGWYSLAVPPRLPAGGAVRFAVDGAGEEEVRVLYLSAAVAHAAPPPDEAAAAAACGEVEWEGEAWTRERLRGQAVWVLLPRREEARRAEARRAEAAAAEAKGGGGEGSGGEGGRGGGSPAANGAAPSRWTEAEEEKLRRHIEAHGASLWDEVAKQIGRSTKSVKRHWQVMTGAKSGKPRAAAKTEAAKTEAAKTEAAKTEAGKAEAGKAEAGKAEAGKAEAGKAEAGKAEAGKAEAGKAEAGKAEAGKAEAGKAEAGKAEAGKAEAATAEAGKVEAGKAEVGKTEGGKAEGEKPEACKVEGGKAQVAKAEVAKADLGKTKSKGKKRKLHRSCSDSEEDTESENGAEARVASLQHDVDMQTDHNCVGLVVHTRHLGKLHAGKVVGWYPPHGDEKALFHVVLSDGEEEDVDEEDILEALHQEPRRTGRQRATVAGSRLVEEIGSQHSASSAVRFHLTPRNDWRGFERRMGTLGGRNELGWRGGTPLPTPPPAAVGDKPCWLLPSDDCTALLVAQMAPELEAAGWRVITSPAHVITRLGDKANLHRYAEEIGMLSALPQHYASPEEATYPCILKAAKGEYGKNTYLVRSKADVRAVTTCGFGREWVLQELIRGRHELCTSLLLKHGEVHDAVTTTYDYAEDEYIWPYVKEVTANRFSTREVVPEHMQILRAFLAEYEGVCNFNYKVRPDGSLAIFEINTRLGADLGCDVPAPILRKLMSTLDAL